MTELKPHLARVERIARQVEEFFKEGMPGVDIGRIACLAADMMAKELTGQTIAAPRPAGEVGELVNKLTRKVQALPTQGGGSISFGGEASHYITDDGKRLVNPDGPEAAAHLTALSAEVERLKALLVDAEQALTSMIRGSADAEEFAQTIAADIRQALGPTP